jgi:predicted MFS family arabinose efflux permease
VIDASSSFAAAAMLFTYLPKQERVKSHQPGSALLDSSTSAYRDFHYLFFILLVSVFGLCFFQLFASIPQYFNKVCKYNEDTIGLLLALNGLMVVIFEMPLITWLGKKNNIFSYIIAGTLCIPVAFFILLFGNGLVIMAVIYTIVLTLAEIFAMPFMMNYSLSRPHKERQGQYSALYSISYGIANIAAPSLGLWIASRYGFNSMFYFFILLAFLAALGFSWLRNQQLNSLGKKE